MVPTKTKPLTDESETLLATIRGSVLVHLQDGLLPNHLVGPLESARQLNALAVESLDTDLAAAADVLKTWLGLLVTETEPISDKRARSILDQISAVEAALMAYRGRSEAATLDVSEFVDESFSELDLNARKHSPPSKLEPDDFEIDSEMIEVFRDEADDLLQKIRSNLEILGSDPTDRNALWEIQRSAHTFKGASGIIGLKRASTLAHRIEDLLGRLSQNGGATDREIVPLLLDATECLTLLSDPSTGAAVDGRFTNLCKAFDNFSEKKTNRIDESSESDTPAATFETKLPATAGVPKGKARVVRISLDRLDDLVSYVRKLVAGRQKFVDDLENLGVQLKESRSNYTRLLSATGRIDSLSGSESGDVNNDVQTIRNGFRQSAYELAETTQDAALINDQLADVKKHLEDLAERQHSLLQEMQSRLLRLRKVEFGTITTRLQRTVGVTCDEEGKRAELVIENPTTEVDTTLIDTLIEPLMHLLKNAIVHGIESPEIRRMLGKNETGRIRVRIDNRGRDLMLKVSDDGRGIAFQPLLEKAVASGLVPESEKDQLTRRRLHDLLFVPGLTTAERLTLNAGRGVGMSIVREAVSGAGGIVELETSPQHGTAFTMIIPCVTESQTSSKPSTSSEDRYENSRSRGTVLIVDDSPSVRLSTARLLESAGWHIVVANNGLEAIDKLRDMDDHPVAIVSDIEMPLMDGYDLLTEIRHDDKLREIPVIFVSSRSGNGERERALNAGAEEYILKPFEDKKLVAMVDSLATEREGILVF